MKMTNKTRNIAAVTMVAGALAFGCSTPRHEGIAKTSQTAPQTEPKVTCLKPSEMSDEKVKAAFEALRPLFADKDPKVQEGLAAVIEKLGPATLPYLLKEGDRTDPVVRLSVAHSIGLVGNPSAIPKLVSMRYNTYVAQKETEKKRHTLLGSPYISDRNEAESLVTEILDSAAAVEESTNAINKILVRAKHCNAVEVPVPKTEQAKSPGPSKTQ